MGIVYCSMWHLRVYSMMIKNETNYLHAVDVIYHDSNLHETNTPFILCTTMPFKPC